MKTAIYIVPHDKSSRLAGHVCTLSLQTLHIHHTYMHSVHAANYTAMPIYVHALTPVVPTVDCKGGTRPALPTAGETTKNTVIYQQTVVITCS